MAAFGPLNGNESSHVSSKYAQVQQTEADGDVRSSDSDNRCVSKEALVPNNVSRWPLQPQPLKLNATMLAQAVIDFLLALIASLFLGLAGAAIHLDGTPTGSSLGVRVQEASKLGPTVFPIIFAAISSRALKTFGRLAAERGTKLGTLQMLFGSQTIFGMVATQISLGTATVLGAVLLVMWSLSPLGGQASLRALPTYNQSLLSSIPLRYLDTGPASEIWTAENILVQLDGELPSSVNTAYYAALMQGRDTKLSPRDAWGNPKIPRIESLSYLNPDASGWIEVPPANTTESYSSLFGLPIVGLSDHSNSSFLVESSYLALSCSRFDTSAPKDPISAKAGLNISCSQCLYPNVDSPRVIELLGLSNSTNVPAANDTAAVSLDVVSLCSLRGSTQSLINATCEVTQTHVESAISCTQNSCAVTRIRPSTTDKRPANYTAFDYWGANVLGDFRIANEVQLDYPSPAQYFLFDPLTIPVVYSMQPSASNLGVDLTRVQPDDFAHRAAVLLNTWLQLASSSTGFAGSLPTNLSAYGPEHIPVTALKDLSPDFYDRALSFNQGRMPDWMGRMVEGPEIPFVGASTTATVTRYREIYRMDRLWLAILFVSSGVLLLVSLAGIFVRFLTRGPDVFDPVGGLTYGNPHLGLPSSGSFLDASDRSKVLRRANVCLGDVKPDDGVGEIAFAASAVVQPLQRRRLYR